MSEWSKEPDCKSDGATLRWFESYPVYQERMGCCRSCFLRQPLLQRICLLPHLFSTPQGV